MNALELLQMPSDGQRYELVAGVLKMMSPAGGRHGRIANRIAWLLSEHVEAHSLGVVFAAETGFKLTSDPDTVRAPDVAFLSSEKFAQLGDDIGYIAMAPDLAVEVISPSDSFSEVERKARQWMEAGCQMLLIVDPQDETVLVYRSLKNIELLRAPDVFDAAPVIPGWRCPIERIFTR